MKKSRIKSATILFIYLFCFLTVAESKAQLIIDSTISPLQLVQNVLVGSGVSAFNVTHSGPPNSIGAYSGITDLGLHGNRDTNLVFLPDGSGANYSVSINVNQYPAGTTILQADDIRKLCINIEHSYLGDLEMQLSCPNGTTATIFNSFNGGLIPGGFNGGNKFLGEANAASTAPGIGWEYCFADNAVWGNFAQEFVAGNFTNVTSPPSPSNGQAMSAGTYKPEQLFSTFVGCPVNGNWTLIVRDNLSMDDGNIFGWDISFDPTLNPSSGIVLTTGSVSSAVGPNTSVGATIGATGITSTDPDLASLASSTMKDANILEFDFIPISDTVVFSYIFASEEYPEYISSGFNDVFGFFVSGVNPTGGNYVAQNFALVPGTSSPVSINTINTTINNILFYDNYTTPGSTIQFDGFTLPLEAKFAVQCGTTYHIKIAITDVLDAAYDSGVFLEEVSFISTGPPAPIISGVISNSSGNISSGSVVLYSNGSFDTNFDTVAVSSIDVNGYYEFLSVNPGNYVIKAFPNTSIYPNAITTYYGNDFVWDTSIVINQTCGAPQSYNITLLEGENPLSGAGAISGVITEGFGFSRLEGDPIPGIDVKLGRNPGGQLVTSTQTDVNGVYTFSSVPFNDGGANGVSYTVYVDIPGLGRDSSYVITLNASNPVADSLDYLADSTTIYINENSSTGISNIDLAKENKFTVYPNPFNASTTIAYTLFSSSLVKLEVYNVLGEKVQTLVNGTQAAAEFKYNLNNLNPGVYFVSLTINGKNSTHRIIKMD